MSSADRCTSSRIDRPCARCIIRFSKREYPPHSCSSLAAFFLPFISQYANRLLHLVSRCSQIPVRNLLFSARRSLRPAQFFFLSASHSVLVTRILLLADCCFLFLICLILIKCQKLFTLMNLNLTRGFRSNGVGLFFGSTIWVKYLKNNPLFLHLI